jgi:formylglycine-generating enzyme required for sulfatase activity
MKRQIGDYILKKQIGHGSLGKTFLAEHRLLKRPYIVKVLSSELSADASFIARFEAEVQKLSLLKHPYIAHLHTVFSSEGVCALVSEPILNATDLGQYIKDSDFQLTEEIIFQIATQLASALDFAHHLDTPVAHGTIKLKNIVIKETSSGVLAYFTDFGLSSVLGPLEVLNRTYHQVSTLLGFSSERCPWEIEKASELQRSFCESFFFLAPEQKVSNHPLANPVQSDAYAFGTLLYYLLTSEFPQGYFELPSKKSPLLKRQWDRLICSLLQPDPLKRPHELVCALEETAIPLSSAVAQLQQLRELAPQEAFASLKPALRPQEISRPSFDADPAAVFQIDTTIATYKPKPQEEKEISPLLTEMVVIPGGTYLRGSHHGGKDEMPRHSIILESFALDVHPVTNEQFVRFLEAMGGEKDSNNSDIIRLKEARIKRNGGKISIESGYDRHPVVGVTWYGAVAYAKWIGKRLPTEAEWEIAAYGGKEDSMYPTGAHMERSEGNFFSSDTTPVMTYAPNPIGLFDMAGNVYEWCQDWYDHHFYDLSMQEPHSPKGPAQGVYRVLRGGCWKSSKEDLRCAHRHRNNPGVVDGTYGFRCAADVVIS